MATSGLARSAGRICTSGAFIEQNDFVFNVGGAGRFCSSRGSNEIPSQNEGVGLIVKNLLGMSGIGSHGPDGFLLVERVNQIEGEARRSPS
jgi:hypothetical protein